MMSSLSPIKTRPVSKLVLLSPARHPAPQALAQPPLMGKSVRKAALGVLCLCLATGAKAQQVIDLNLKGVPADLISPTASPNPAIANMQPQWSGPPRTGVNTMTVSSSLTDNSGPPRIAQSPPSLQGNSTIAPINLGQSLPQRSPQLPSSTSEPNTYTWAVSSGQVQLSNSGPMRDIGSGMAQRAAVAARQKMVVRHSADPLPSGPPERVLFNRAPIRLTLPLGKERLITFPSAIALHVPSDMDQVVRISNIDRTLYVTALVPFTPLRIIAELIDTGEQIPMDWVANKTTAFGTSELLISVVDANGVRPLSSGDPAPNTVSSSPSSPSAPSSQNSPLDQQGAGGTLDMVELTRFAARQLYAPLRLATPVAQVVQINVALTPIPTLIRGINAQIVPLGAWRSGALYVTAVRVTNRSAFALEIPLEQLRGDWIAATAQHARVGAAGTATDTTAVYLISSRPFEACL